MRNVMKYFKKWYFLPTVAAAMLFAPVSTEALEHHDYRGQVNYNQASESSSQAVVATQSTSRSNEQAADRDDQRGEEQGEEHGEERGRLFFRPYGFGPGFYGPYYYAWPYGRYNYWPYNDYYAPGYPYGPYGGYYSDSGAVRTEVKPKQTRIYVDGYYAGTADDYDGFFQRLYLAPGGHTIELWLGGYQVYQQHIMISPGHTDKIKHDMALLPPGESTAPPPEPQGPPELQGPPAQ